MRTILFLLIASMTSCSAMRGPWGSKTPFVGEDGNDNWWIIKCHRDEDACLLNASEACPQGYEVREKDAGPLNTRMIITCRGKVDESNASN